MNPEPMVSKDRAIPRHKKYLDISISCWKAASQGAAAANSFSARRQDLPFGPCKRGERDCLTGMRPILKSGFQPLADKVAF
jgi:hypothetical protein